MAKLGQVLQRLDRKRMPVHITAATRQMIETTSKAFPFPANLVLRQLLNPTFTDIVLRLLGKQVEQFEPLLHNTVNPTAIVWADNPIRIPDRIGLRLACIMLPGFSPEDRWKNKMRKFRSVKPYWRFMCNPCLYECFRDHSLDVLSWHGLFSLV